MKYIVIDQTANLDLEKGIVYSGRFERTDPVSSVEDFFLDGELHVKEEVVVEIANDLRDYGYANYEEYHFETIG